MEGPRASGWITIRTCDLFRFGERWVVVILRAKQEWNGVGTREKGKQKGNKKEEEKTKKNACVPLLSEVTVFVSVRATD